MTTDQLVFISSWASIISLVVAVISLLLVRSIKTNIIRFRRKQRLRELRAAVDEVWPGTLSTERVESLLQSLRRNFPIWPWSKLTNRGRLVIELHRKIDENDLLGIKEVIKDLTSFSEDV